MRIGRRDVRLTNLEKVYFPERGLTKGDLVAYYVDVADCVLHHVRRRPMQMKRYPDGVDGFFFYQKRVPEPASGLAGHVPDPVSERAPRRLPGRRRRCRTGVDRQPRLHRAAHVALADRRRRAAGLPADRPRPERGQPLVARPRDRDGGEGGDGRAGAGLVPEDLGRDRPAHPRADSARAPIPGTSAISRRRSRRRSSGGSTTSRSRRRRGRSPTASACSSTTARTRGTGRSRPRTRSGRCPTRARPRR